MQVLRDQDADDLLKVWILLQLSLETGMDGKGSLAGGGILECGQVISSSSAWYRPSSSTVKALSLAG
jgi:hypothetical protein